MLHACVNARVDARSPTLRLTVPRSSRRAGGVLATIAAAGTLALHPSWISRLVSFAVGALLGAVFLELLPHALETGGAER